MQLAKRTQGQKEKALENFRRYGISKVISINQELDFENLKALTKLTFEFAECYYTLMDRRLAAELEGDDVDIEDTAEATQMQLGNYANYFYTRLRAGEKFCMKFKDPAGEIIEMNAMSDEVLNLDKNAAKKALAYIIRFAFDCGLQFYPPPSKAPLYVSYSAPKDMEDLIIRS